jgi:hypothetical protein
MQDINSLATRIDAEFAAVEEKVKKFQREQQAGHQERQKRLDQLGKTFDDLAGLWRPRLEMLVQKFGDRVKATPRLTPSTREGIFDFQSNVAKVRLKFSASTDRDVQKVILGYDLEIIPILMRFKPHDEIEFPLGAVDKEAAARWIDDRIVDFIHTYFSMGENEIYMKDQMVEDPIAHVTFPRMAAGATLEWKGQKFYFIGDETRRQFAQQNKIPTA